MLMFSCVCAFADASVLGIFEDTNFPAEAVEEQDGVHRLEGVFNPASTIILAYEA